MWAWILQSVFPALLPPANGGNIGDESSSSSYEYYEILGLPKYSSVEQVRSAYKKLSLKLHPDKQANTMNIVDKAAVAAQYERVQEANNVLAKDEHKRKLYHDMRCSVARYTFVESGSILHPVAVHENLLRASCIDKTRLLGMAILIMAVILVPLILIAVKVNGQHLQQVNWMGLFIPFYIVQVLHAMIRLAMVYFDPTAFIANMVALLESIAWFVVTMVVSYQIEYQSLHWGYVSMTWFIAMGLRFTSFMLALRDIRSAQDKMVTEEYLRHVVRPHNRETNNAALNDNEENENNDDTDNDDDEKDYIIVEPDEHVVMMTVAMMNTNPNEQPPLSRDELEQLRVQTSLEFRAAQDMANGIIRQMTIWLLIYLPLAILVTLRLTNVLNNTSWWIVFIPLWIYLSVRLLTNIFVCCCLMPPGFMEQEAAAAAAEAQNNAAATAADTAAATDLPTSRYFNGAESEMSAFGDWGSEKNLTSERIAKVRTEELGMVVIDLETTPAADTTAPATTTIQNGAAAVPPPLVNGTQQQQQQQQQQRDETKDQVDASPKAPASATAAPANDNNGAHTANGDNNNGAAEHDVPAENDDDDDDGHGHGHANHHDNEEEYMQAKMQACAGSCSSCLELIVICTIVGLLQTPNAYNALWVLFPLFLFCAIVLALVCCCIYARLPTDNAAAATGNRGGGGVAESCNTNDEENQQQQQQSQSQQTLTVVAEQDEQQSQSREAVPAAFAADGGVVSRQEAADANQGGSDDKDPTSHSEMDDLD